MGGGCSLAHLNMMEAGGLGGWSLGTLLIPHGWGGVAEFVLPHRTVTQVTTVGSGAGSPATKPEFTAHQQAVVGRSFLSTQQVLSAK